MALQRATQTPVFESQDEPAGIDAGRALEIPTMEEAVEAESVASTAIAKAQGTALAVKAPKFKAAFQDQQWVLDVEAVESLALAAPKIKGEQGSFFLGEKKLGEKIRLELISWNRRFAIGTGEKVNNDETKKAFRVSYDGETISGQPDVTVKAYMESLKAEGYKDAKISSYGDLWGFLTWSEKEGIVAEEDYELVCLQASQTSLGQWELFCKTQGILQSRGSSKESAEVEATATVKAKGTDKYTMFNFSRPKK